MQTYETFDRRYRIVQELGSGSEGQVFLALYVPTEEFRAVKKIRTGGGFACRELEMMKQLHNEHLPRVIDVITNGACTYLVMEHVRGSGMDRILSGGRCLTADQAEEAALQITDALCYLESRDPPVCHLDIKPSNLIRRPDGCIMLVDFGAAWKEQLDRPGMGTDGYAAPEQYIAGRMPDTRADIYGLGAVLYRMMAGKTWSPVLRGSRIPNCPEEFGNLIAKCLQTDPEDRFRSAEELRMELVRLRKMKKRKERRIRILGALAVALPAAAFGTCVLPASIDLSGDPEWNYESLLKEAEISGESESRQYYRKAVFMNPARSDAYLKYLEDAGSDGILSAEEDIFLRELLHSIELGMDETCEDALRKDPDAYGETALRIGLLYWYCSQETDSRRIASGWFSRAVEAGTDTGTAECGDWLETARLYEKLASFTGTEAAERKDGQEAEAALRYWEILGELTEQTDRFGSPFMELDFCSDALTRISFLCRDLELAGAGPGEQTEMIRKLIQKTREIRGTPEEEKTLRIRRARAEEAALFALTAVDDLERAESVRKKK